MSGFGGFCVLTFSTSFSGCFLRGGGGRGTEGLQNWRAGGLAGWEFRGVFGVLVFAFAEIWGGFGFLGVLGGVKGRRQHHSGLAFPVSGSNFGALKAMLLSDFLHCEG